MIKRSSKLQCVVLTLILLMVFICSGIQCSALVEAGQAAPNFTLNDTKGEKLSLSDLKGKKVFLNFWATWCGPCVNELPDFQSLYNEKLSDVVILAVSIDSSIDTVKSFMSSNSYNFRCLFDASGSSVLSDWGITAIPTQVFIDANGIISSTHLGGLTKAEMLEYINKIPGDSAPTTKPTDTPTLKPTNTPTTKPTNTPTSVPTEKVFKLSGWIGPDLASSNTEIKAGFTVEICVGDLCLAPTKTDKDGFFSFDNLKAGTYKITITKENYLKRIIKDVIISGNKQIGSKDLPIYIWCGDMMKNGIQDNVINLADIMEIAASFNSVKGDSRYTAGRDINTDGAINMADIMAVVTHFNSTADSYPAV